MFENKFIEELYANICKEWIYLPWSLLWKIHQFKSPAFFVLFCFFLSKKQKRPEIHQKDWSIFIIKGTRLQLTRGGLCSKERIQIPQLLLDFYKNICNTDSFLTDVLQGKFCYLLCLSKISCFNSLISSTL